MWITKSKIFIFLSFRELWKKFVEQKMTFRSSRRFISTANFFLPCCGFLLHFCPNLNNGAWRPKSLNITKSTFLTHKFMGWMRKKFAFIFWKFYEWICWLRNDFSYKIHFTVEIQIFSFIRISQRENMFFNYYSES